MGQPQPQKEGSFRGLGLRRLFAPRRRRRFARSTRGASMLEGALILVVLLTLLLTVVDFGMTYFVESAGELATEQGAYVLAKDLKAGEAQSAAEAAALQTASSALLGAGSCVDASTSGFDYWPARADIGTTNPSLYGTFIPGQTSYARFRLVCDWTFFSPLSYVLFGGDQVTLRSQTTVSVQ